MAVYKVKNIEEAMQMANKFKSSGAYNLFRGQAQNWKLTSTRARLQETEEQDAKEKMQRFMNFLTSDPELLKYREDIDWTFAVAQHYGLPTPYIDFSTSVEVAAYFATNSNANKQNVESVILCLSEVDFQEFIIHNHEPFEKGGAEPPYVANVDVENLWRLQAQYGTFLYTPTIQIENLYSVDKIIFPYTAPYQGILEEDIYPKRKSELEIKLDRFFDSERNREGNKEFIDLFNTENSTVIDVSNCLNEKILKSPNLHESWTEERINEWQYPLKEKWSPTSEEQVVFAIIPSYDDPMDVINALWQQLKKLFSRDSFSKESILKFKITTEDPLKESVVVTMENKCSLIWNGTRNLPYTVFEVLLIIAQYLALEQYRDRTGNIYGLSEGKPITIELGDAYGNYARTKANATELRKAFRDDLKGVIIDDYDGPMTAEFLLSVNKPQLVFDFERFKKLFIYQMMCYQMLLNYTDDFSCVFFSPTELATFGYR